MLAEQRATDLSSTSRPSRGLEPLPDAEVTASAGDVLLGLKLEIDKHKPIGMIAR